MTEIKIQGAKYEMALIFAELDAIKTLLSVIITFLFWLLLAIVLIAVYLLCPTILGHLLSLYKVLSFLGLSVVVLTVLTWKIILKLMWRYYFQWYTRKYAKCS
jgi:hypothetical protein